MNSKKIIAIVLCIFTLVTLTGCFGASLPASIDDEGKFVYAITRSGAEKSVEIDDAARVLRTAMKDGFDCKISMIKDTAYEDYDGNYEILIGDTNREASKTAKDRLLNNRPNNANDFIVAVIDEKICINSVQKSVIVHAVNWFAKNFCASVEDWAKLKKGYEFIYEHENVSGAINTVADADLGTYTVVMPRVASYLVGFGAEEFEDYYTNFGYKINAVEDIDPEVEREILFGDTSRKESQSVKVEGDNYVIKVVGTKLVVKGGTDLATHKANEVLMAEIKKMESGTGFNWSDGYTINGKYDPNEKGAYTLNWNDEFEGTEVDLNKWGDYRNKSHEVGTSCLGGFYGNQDVFGDTAYKGPGTVRDLIYQADGKLHLGAQHVAEKDFVNGQVSTYYTMVYRYGFFEIRARHAETPANVGYWANGASSDSAEAVKRFGTVQQRPAMTEIDMLENFGSNTAFHSNVHRWWSSKNIEGATVGSDHNALDGSSKYSGNSLNNKKKVYDTERYGDDLSKDFHLYGCYWDDSCMKFYFDGKVYLDYQFDENQSVSVHCLMNYFNTESHIGSAAYGVTYDPDEHKDYYETEIDYIRIYQSDRFNSQMITAWPERQANGTSTIRYPDHDVARKY